MFEFFVFLTLLRPKKKKQGYISWVKRQHLYLQAVFKKDTQLRQTIAFLDPPSVSCSRTAGQSKKGGAYF
jgi:hypothetical protein